MDTPAPRGRSGRRLLLVLAALALFVTLLPTAVAKTPLRDWLLGIATSDLNGRVAVGDARFGWFGAQAIHDVTVYDDKEDVVAHVEAVTIENGLLKLILDRAHVGTVRVDKPDLHVVFAEDFNNIERILRDLVTRDEDTEEIESSDSPLTVAVNIVDARVELVDVVNAETWLIDELNADCVVGDRTAGDIDVKLVARVPNGDDAAALKLALSQTPSSESPEAGSVNLRVQSQRLPLQLVGAAMMRVVPGIKLSGLAAVDLSCAWSYASDAPLSLSIQGQVTVEGATLGGPWFAEGERLTLAHVTAPCQFTLDKNGISVEQMSVQCGDLGQIVASGAMTRTDGVWQPVAESPLECSAIIDLAKLANMIPRTVGLYDGMSLATGNVELRASGGQDAKGTIINAAIKTGDIVAVKPSGQTVSWEQPVSITLAARQDDVKTSGADTTGLVDFVFERIDLRSDFAQIEARGTPSSMMADARLDLAMLAEHLRQFVDMGDTAMAGRAGAHVEWQIGGQQATALVEAKVNDLELSISGRAPLVEPTLNISASLNGQAKENTLQTIDTASFQLAARDDRFMVTLSEPIDVAAGRWPLAITAAGDISRWLSRGRPWLGPDVAANLSGGVTVGAAAEWTPTGVTISAAEIRFLNARGDLFGVMLDEPSAQLDLAAAWNRERDAVELRNVVLRSSAVGLSSERLILSGSSLGTFHGDGQVLFAADLARLSPAVVENTKAGNGDFGHAGIDNGSIDNLARVRLPAQRLAVPLPPGTKTAAGRLDGSLTFTSTGTSTAFITDATIQNLVVTSAGGSTWQEPKVTVRSNVKFDAASNAVVVDALSVVAQAIAVEASGRIDRPDADGFVDVVGTLKYDWARLRPALAAYLPDEVQISGVEARPFTIKGPLAASAVAVSTDASGAAAGPLGALTAQTSIGWQEAMIYGFRLETANLPITLEGGMLRLEHSEVVTNGGQIALDGELRVSPQPRDVYVPAGRVVDHVEITPEMCSQGLMYISPIFAGVTEASGKFSVDVKQLKLPLEMPQQGKLSGEVTVHTVQLGPGPLIQELSVLFANRGSIRLKKESVVPFEMYEGRIYHRDLVLQFPDFEIRMTGSVGLDGTLDMTAEMPIPTKWIGNNALGDFLKNRVIEVPIGGTVEHPRIDHQRLEELSASFFRDSAASKVESEIGRQLNRFFSPSR
jgi:hypothetical protein